MRGELVADEHASGGGSLRRYARISLLGAAAPAVIGVASVVLANVVGPADALAQMLAIWSVIGFLTLSDLGLMRTASQRVSNGEAGRHVVRSLSRSALSAGVLIGFVLLIFLATVGPSLEYPTLMITGLAVLPGLMLLQFPIVGALEATGSFTVVALNKGLNAVATYALPAAMLSIDGGGPVLELLTIITYRLVALFWTYRAIPRAVAPPMAPVAPKNDFYVWVAASSIIGPVFLYADRLAIGGLGAQDLWIFYSTTSEMLLRSYIVPTSLVAALFPWTVRGLTAFPERVATVYARWLPIATLVTAAITTPVALAFPDALFRTLGVSTNDTTQAKVAIAMMLAGTMVNWSSQAQIAIIHALNMHRGVFLAQLSLLAPYLIALYFAASSGVAAIAAAWLVRIVLNWICLYFMVDIGLKRHATRISEGD